MSDSVFSAFCVEHYVPSRPVVDELAAVIDEYMSRSTEHANGRAQHVRHRLGAVALAIRRLAYTKRERSSITVNRKLSLPSPGSITSIYQKELECFLENAFQTRLAFGPGVTMPSSTSTSYTFWWLRSMPSIALIFCASAPDARV